MHPFSRPLVYSLMLAVIALSGCGKSEEAGSPKVNDTQAAKTAATLPKVTVITATMRTIQPRFELPATIEAVQTAAIRPEVDGVIKAQHFTPGALVEKGDLLVELDDAEYRAKLAGAEAALNAAKAGSKQAEANWQRAQQLKPKGYISGQDFDLAQAKAGTAKAEIAQFEAKLERAKLNLGDTKIHAPFSGKISAAQHAIGDRVGPLARKPLFELVQLDPIYALGQVEQSLHHDFILKRQKLKKRGVEIPDLEVRLRLPSGAEYRQPGEFQEWDHSATAQTGTIAGRVEFPNPDGLLLPGENLTVFGRFIDKGDRIIIPQKAVAQDQEGHYVLILDPDDVVQRRNIEVGIRDGADWAVIDGLEAGDRVVVDGLQNARPGTKVAPRVIGEPAASGPSGESTRDQETSEQAAEEVRKSPEMQETAAEADQPAVGVAEAVAVDEAAKELEEAVGEQAAEEVKDGKDPAASVQHKGSD